MTNAKEELFQLASLVALHAILSRPASFGVMPSTLVEMAIEIAREYVDKLKV